MKNAAGTPNTIASATRSAVIDRSHFAHSLRAARAKIPVTAMCATKIVSRLSLTCSANG